MLFIKGTLKKFSCFVSLPIVLLIFVSMSYASQDISEIKQLSMDELIQHICISHDSLKHFVKYISPEDSSRFINTIQEYIDFYKNEEPLVIFTVRERSMEDIKVDYQELREYIGDEQFKRKYGQYENFFSKNGPRAQIKKYFCITGYKDKIEELKTLEVDKLINEYSKIEQLLAQEKSEFRELLRTIVNKSLMPMENLDAVKALLSNKVGTDSEKVGLLRDFYDGISYMIKNQERMSEAKEILHNILPLLGIGINTELSIDVINDFDNKYSALLKLEREFDNRLLTYRDRLIDYKYGEDSYRGNALELFVLNPIFNLCYDEHSYIVSPLEPLARVIPVALYNSIDKEFLSAYTIQLGFIWNHFPSYTDTRLNQCNYFYRGIALAFARCDWKKISFSNDGNNGIGIVYLHSYLETGAFWFKDYWAFSIGINDYSGALQLINKIPFIKNLAKVLPMN